MMSDVRNSPEDFEWENATEIISERQEMIQERFANTLAAFGVEVFRFVSSLILISGLVVGFHVYSIVDGRQR